ncbi:hypothetical protein C8R41DRAFT_337275 [Lentinula lateritia]|uniref:Uncharacterized protein n=1 Tax=Lentinula lateritia TaxID=40482 RepID=A0ABQ8VFP8_9AGAR|nr:hypothetical protein C8R41DRAFT_337275 [Lentinula lateritia]
MSLSQASTPTKIHQPRPLYFTSDMFPRTSLLSPFVPPLPLKTKSVDSPSAENPSFISNTDCLPPFRKQRSLPTTITSAMDKAKSSGTKCRPMPRVASFPACQESVVIGRPRADSIVSDLRSASGATRFRVGRRMFASGSTPPPTQKIPASSLSTPPPNINRISIHRRIHLSLLALHFVQECSKSMEPFTVDIHLEMISRELTPLGRTFESIMFSIMAWDLCIPGIGRLQRIRINTSAKTCLLKRLLISANLGKQWKLVFRLKPRTVMLTLLGSDGIVVLWLHLRRP